MVKVLVDNNFLSRIKASRTMEFDKLLRKQREKPKRFIIKKRNQGLSKDYLLFTYFKNFRRLSLFQFFKNKFVVQIFTFEVQSCLICVISRLLEVRPILVYYSQQRLTEKYIRKIFIIVQSLRLFLYSIHQDDCTWSLQNQRFLICWLSEKPSIRF